MELRSLIKGLTDPAAYPYPTSPVEVRQTHISVVFLAGEYVYKVKKPVDLGYLNFSDLDKRRFYCGEEVRLNRRLAPEVYLGVVPVARTPGGLRFEAEGEAVEWAVKMRRLPEAATLARLLEHGLADGPLVEGLARRVASFHRAARTDERIASFGRFEAVTRAIRDVLDRAGPATAETVHAEVTARVTALAEDALAGLRQVIEARAARGVPRDCHGDLRLDHVYCFPDREPPGDLVVIDCIEFSDGFRFIDPVADIAFLVMDLLAHGSLDLAGAFARAYFASSGDGEGESLLPLYTAYRAAVRARVAEAMMAEPEVPKPERASARDRARARWLLALGQLEQPARRPCLALVGGLPGTGKSTLARGLAERAGFHVVRSDEVRKELADPAPPGGIYTAEWAERTYDECLRRAEGLLREGKRPAVDATFVEEHRRRLFLTMAERWGVPAVFLICRSDPEVTRERLRSRRGDVSDADWGVYVRAAERWEEPGPSTSAASLVVDTSVGREPGLAAALQAFAARGLFDLGPG